MKTQFNEKTGITTWLIEKWYQKVFYVAGLISVGLFTLGFFIGFIAGVLEN